LFTLVGRQICPQLCGQPFPGRDLLPEGDQPRGHELDLAGQGSIDKEQLPFARLDEEHVFGPLWIGRPEFSAQAIVLRAQDLALRIGERGVA
jgi:hypothetical protein